jgi:hypothetical protein
MSADDTESDLTNGVEDPGVYGGAWGGWIEEGVGFGGGDEMGPGGKVGVEVGGGGFGTGPFIPFGGSAGDFLGSIALSMGDEMEGEDGTGEITGLRGTGGVNLVRSSLGFEAIGRGIRVEVPGGGER